MRPRGRGGEGLFSPLPPLPVPCGPGGGEEGPAGPPKYNKETPQSLDRPAFPRYNSIVIRSCQEISPWDDRRSETLRCHRRGEDWRRMTLWRSPECRVPKVQSP